MAGWWLRALTLALSQRERGPEGRGLGWVEVRGTLSCERRAVVWAPRRGAGRRRWNVVLAEGEGEAVADVADGFYVALAAGF